MEENINDRIRKYIIKHIVGKIGYSQETRSFQLLLRQMRTTDRILFREEIRKYESWQNMTENNIDKFIDDVRLSVGLCNKTRRTTYPSLMLENIAEGNIISLYEYDARQGESYLRLLYMGKNDAGIQRFFVIKQYKIYYSYIMVKNVFIFRHGQTDKNLAGLWQGYLECRSLCCFSCL